jgi:outer membrane lipoprotein-sorting protein
MRSLVLARRARWAAPAIAVSVVAAGVAVSAITIAQAAPQLPARSPGQLLAAAAGQAREPALTGTVVETASLGLPQLPGDDNPASVTSLLAGSHTLRVWFASPSRFRLAVLVPMGENDLIRNGRTVWLWDSASDSVTRLPLPASGHEPAGAAEPPLTPQQAAREVLAAAGPTTRVSAERNVTVAGQAAYQLVLEPRDSRSLIGRVTIALDGQHPAVPLRVQVFARGATSPAFQVGYTSVSFVQPAPANFTFTPPPRARVRTLSPPSTPVACAPAAPSAAGRASHQRASRAARHKVRAGRLRAMVWPRCPGKLPPAGGMQPRLAGRGWLTVAVLPGAVATGQAVQGGAASAAGQAARSLAGQGGGVSNAAVLAALLKAARPVHGPWGSGRLLRTSLVSVLFTSKGQVLLGAVDPSVLYAADRAR